MIVKIDKKRLEELMTDVISFKDDPSKEKDVIELIEAKKSLDDLYAQITTKLKEDMVKDNLSSVEGDMARISISQAGYKYIAKDLKQVSPDFLELKLSMGSISDYEKKEGKLPENIEYNPKRSYSCRISIKGGVHE